MSSTCSSSVKPLEVSLLLRLVRVLLLDLPLAVLFASFMAIYMVRVLHDEYYRPLFDRAQRTDEDLLEEFTYYERQCNEYDLTTRNIQDLFLDESAGANTVPHAVEQMMTHGGLVIPKVLQSDTVQQLREYIVRRNAAVTDEEVYPVSQGTNRLSYGIDPTEDPAVARAVQEVANNPLILKILQNILGDVDPASTEVTAITAYAGCPDQVWHADTKGEGNALKYARTYSHSYSLFLPLQNTTAAMGSTDVCPGTHYCANDLELMCETNKMGLHLATPEGVFRAGDGALLNQHVWHRGSAHTDPNAPERILFILSFLARPRFGKDPRQLARGTYFHQLWRNWGHTWKDLTDPYLSMQKPFSILRCLHLWKPKGYNWGYDLITSGFLRFSNEQLEYEDLPYRLIPRLDQLGFPKWLRGRVVEEESQKESWEIFVRETIGKTFEFVQKVNVLAHAGYAALLLLIAMVLSASGKTMSSFRLLRAATIRLTMTHGFLFGLTCWTLYQTRISKWGSDILSGRTLMRPFPPVDVIRDDEKLLYVSEGPTTFPQRPDILIGTRYSAPFLGAYDRWLDYHPGNVVFRKAALKRGRLYRTYLHHEIDVFASRLEQEVLEESTRLDGRFLLQDFRTGDWRVMTDVEVNKVIREELLSAGSPLLSDLRKFIDWMIAEYRFGTLRTTSLARLSILSLVKMRQRIFLVNRPSKGVASQGPEESLWNTFVFLEKSTWRQQSRSPAAQTNRMSSRRSSLPLHIEPRGEFLVGSLVWMNFSGREYYPGSITGVHENDSLFDIAFDDGTQEFNVRRELLNKMKPVTEGIRVAGCYRDQLQECYEGIVRWVSPSGQVMVEFDDGDVEWQMPPNYYYVPPYRYGWDYY